jgi:4-amino-4-deoxy-L-arabinose transferase-like glycosyltransferase
MWFYFVNEHFLRFTTKEHGRYEPAWFFLPVLIGGFFPWTLFGWQAVKNAVAGGWKARREHAEAWFLLIWVAFILLFFSKSQSKLIPYILPVFPALAVLVGHYLVEAFPAGALKRGRVAAWTFVGLLGVFAVAVLVMKAPKGQPDFAAQLPLLKPLLAGVLLIGAGMTAYAIRRNCGPWVRASIAGATASLLLVLSYTAQELDHSSSKDFAVLLQSRIQPEDRLYTVGIYPQDLPVYLDRLVSVVDYKGEMEFGIDSEPAVSEGRFLNREGFFKQWAEPGPAYALMRTWYYEKLFVEKAGPHQIIGSSDKLILVVKTHPIP